MRKLVIISGMLLLVGTSLAQLSQHALAVQEKAQKLKVDAHISLSFNHAPQVFGNFVSSNPTGLTLYDVDQHKNLSFEYENISKLKTGYGGKNSVTGKHTDLSKGLIITLVAVGGLAAIIVAAASAR